MNPLALITSVGELTRLPKAQITILRVSLIFPHQSFLAEIQKRSAALPPASASRLLRGPALCAGAARAIAVQTLQLADRRRSTHSTVLGAGQAFLAAVVLAFGVLREPASRLARADVELLCSVTEHVEEFYLQWGQDEAFVGIFGQLRERVLSVFRDGGGGGLRAGAGGLHQRGSGVGEPGEECDGLAQGAHQGHGAVSMPLMGLNALMDFDMGLIGGPEFCNLIEADFACWGA